MVLKEYLAAVRCVHFLRDHQLAEMQTSMEDLAQDLHQASLATTDSYHQQIVELMHQLELMLSNYPNNINECESVTKTQ